jgi:hypothetical protein
MRKSISGGRFSTEALHQFDPFAEVLMGVTGFMYHTINHLQLRPKCFGGEIRYIEFGLFV